MDRLKTNEVVLDVINHSLTLSNTVRDYNDEYNNEKTKTNLIAYWHNLRYKYIIYIIILYCYCCNSEVLILFQNLKLLYP